MTTLLILLILFVLLGYALKEYYQLKLGRPASSPPAVIDELAEFLAQYGPSGRFMDMGSGWGGLVLNLAKRLPEWQIDGIEASPTPWFIANCRSIGKGFSNYRFFIGRMEKQLLQNYDIVFLNQPPKRLAAILPRLVKTLQNDTFILSYPNPIPRLPDPHILLSEAQDKIYLYPGVDALAFMNPPAAEEDDVAASADTAPERVLEPVQEVPPPPPMEPNDDNAFEQLPVDDLPPAELPANDAPVPADIPPEGTTDLPDANRPPHPTD